MLSKLPFLHISLKYKFLIMFAVLVTLPTIGFGMYIYHKMDQSFQAQTVESTKGTVDKIEGNLTSIIEDMENVSLYTIYNEDFRNFMMTPESKINDLSAQQSLENIKGYLTFQLMSKDYISSFYLKGEGGNVVEMGDPVSGDESKWDRLASKKEGGIVWSDAYELSKGIDGRVNVISLSRVINDFNNIKHPIGFMRIRLNVSELKKLIQIPALQRQGTVFLMSQAGDVMIQGNKSEAFSDSDLQQLQQTILKDNQVNFNYKAQGHHYLAVSKKVKGIDWYLVALVSKNKIDQSLIHIRELMRDTFIILILLGLIALVGYYFSDIRRIIALTHSTKQLEQKDFSVHVPVVVKDEIGKLGIRFNHMVETIQNHINQEYKLKIRQKESELKALQSQIDPHFLYNTLDMIRWKARLEQAPETSHLIERLSRIFRNSLRGSALYIHLEDECTFVKSYLDLQNQRMGGSLTYHVTVDQSIHDVYIMKQIIQPLVENSIKHGFENQQAEKVIDIRCYPVGHTLYIDVMDNGMGMNKDLFLEKVASNEGHALKNLQDRLVLAFGPEYGLKWLKMDQQGTWLQLQMPLLTQPSEIQSLYKGAGDMNDENDHSG
ncbi:histidine kinase [Pullulanibacillus camelliae]|uniref:Histidine kinase n=1 Tax=Pullulanibacillus camelliae TaxID=1707096 RepID=A0A8J2VJ92_9BACL|nr:sensor histidine kinase [Pullulanibacillus camelliae]GGE26094.1 histidine kinase [Pullulanibacillus camelliae]